MELYCIDTAGLRKKSKIKESVEFFAALRTFQSVERCDVAIVLFDASIGVEKQDLQIVEYSIEQGKPTVIGVNKWDLVDKKNNTIAEYQTAIKTRLRIYNFVPMIFISVLEKQRIQKLLSRALEIEQSSKSKIKTSELNNYLLPLIERTPPFSKTVEGDKDEICDTSREQTSYICIFTNLPEEVSITYKRFLENKLREKFKFEGVPIRLVFKQK